MFPQSWIIGGQCACVCNIVVCVAAAGRHSVMAWVGYKGGSILNAYSHGQLDEPSCLNYRCYLKRSTVGSVIGYAVLHSVSPQLKNMT